MRESKKQLKLKRQHEQRRAQPGSVCAFTVEKGGGGGSRSTAGCSLVLRPGRNLKRRRGRLLRPALTSGIRSVAAPSSGHSEEILAGSSESVLQERLWKKQQSAQLAKVLTGAGAAQLPWPYSVPAPHLWERIKGWPGLRFSTEITASEGGGKKPVCGRRGREQKDGVMREEGHLLVTRVYEQTASLSNLDATHP